MFLRVRRSHTAVDHNSVATISSNTTASHVGTSDHYRSSPSTASLRQQAADGRSLTKDGQHLKFHLQVLGYLYANRQTRRED
ncbi:hypothetical protein B296_00052165 [Ensete ventricosum]|uniref:Uncharacterized protein n=1 Tax=Ensete ventricosum TaxID=4639 RepID=A0A426YDB6_ENSVE|nr:hypothetical protein B296_00052165 [Ensete ventricosum]